MKIKEYFGIGLPYFYTGAKNDLPDNYPYVFEVSDDESMVDFDALREFYQSYKNKANVPNEMWELAKKSFFGM